MNSPVTKLGKELKENLELMNVETDINKRWEHGEHREDAEILARQIGELDWMFAGDSFCFKFGGDGDNGETLTFLLDILLELNEKLENTWFSEYEK